MNYSFQCVFPSRIVLCEIQTERQNIPLLYGQMICKLHSSAGKGTLMSC